MKRMYSTLFAAVLVIAGCHGDGSDDPSNNVSNAPAVTEISMPNVGPFGVTVSPDGKFAFVAMFGDYGSAGPGNMLAVIDTTTDTIMKTLTVGERPEDIAFTEDGSRGYVVNSNSATLSAIDMSSLTVVDTITIGMAYDPNTWSGMFPYGISIKGGEAYIFSSGNSDGSDENVTIVDVDPTSSTYHQKTGGITKSGAYTRGAFRNGTTELVVSRGMAGNNWNAIPEIAIFDTASDTFVTSFQIQAADGNVHGLEDIAITPNGKYAYASFFSWGGTLSAFEVFVIDLETRTIKDILTLNTGDNSTHGVAMRPDGLLVGVTSWNTGKVSWIFTPTNTVVLEETIGTNPNEIAFAANGTKAYITNQNSQNVSVIQLPSSHQLLIDMVNSGTMTQAASDDLTWRVTGLQNAVAAGDPNVTQVWIDDLAIRTRYWADQGDFSVGQTKDLVPAGATINSVATPLPMGGIHANLQ